MKALRVHVERVVRPIRASSIRKDRMREELLGHLTRLFDEELAINDDLPSAATEAIRRFGDAALLSRELQESVPRIERWAFFSFPLSGPIRRRIGESPIRYILRANAWGFIFTIAGCALCALVATIASSQQPHRADQPSAGQILLFMIGTVILQFAAMIGCGLAYEGIRQGLEKCAVAATSAERRKARWKIVGYSIASSAIVASAFAGLMLLIEMGIPFPIVTRTQFWCITSAAALLGLPFTLWNSWSWKASTRRFDTWESLELDEPHSA